LEYSFSPNPNIINFVYKRDPPIYRSIQIHVYCTQFWVKSYILSDTLIKIESGWSRLIFSQNLDLRTPLFLLRNGSLPHDACFNEASEQVEEQVQEHEHDAPPPIQHELSDPQHDDGAIE